MKVLLFRPHCGTGGIMSWMLLHARQLRRRGFECAFWFCTGSPRLGEFEQAGSVTVGPMSELLHALERGDYDVVHAVNQDALAELLALVRPAPRVVVTGHGELSEAWTRTDCFAYTAVSGSVARLNQPLTDLAVEVIPNGADCERFTPPPAPSGGPPIIAWVGRSKDFRQKDFPRFTRIASLLAAARPARFWVADAHAASWADFAGHDCRQVAIERWQRLAHDEMPGFYRDVAASGGIILMTSRYEGWPMVTLESGAAGVTTVAPDVAGLRDAILPGVTGQLYPATAADEEVTALLLKWLDVRRVRKDGIEECAAAVGHHYSLDTMTDRYLDLYTRPEQRMWSGPAVNWAPDDPDLPALLPRFRGTRRERAVTLSQAARDLARSGNKAVAARALQRAVRVAPGSFLRPSGLVPLLSTLVSLALPARVAPLTGAASHTEPEPAGSSGESAR